MRFIMYFNKTLVYKFVIIFRKNNNNSKWVYYFQYICNVSLKNHQIIVLD